LTKISANQWELYEKKDGISAKKIEIIDYIWCKQKPKTNMYNKTGILIKQGILLCPDLIFVSLNFSMTLPTEIKILPGHLKINRRNRQEKEMEMRKS